MGVLLLENGFGKLTAESWITVRLKCHYLESLSYPNRPTKTNVNVSANTNDAAKNTKKYLTASIKSSLSEEVIELHLRMAFRLQNLAVLSDTQSLGLCHVVLVDSFESLVKR